MNRRQYICFTCALILVTIGNVNSQVQQSATTDLAPETEMRILEKALRYTGFDALEGYSLNKVIGPKLDWHQTDNTPFLHHHFTEGKVWKVTFRNVVVTSEEALIDSTHDYARDFDVYVHPATEKLLKIESRIPEVRWAYTPAGSAEERQAYWQKSGVISMTLPDTRPAPFVDVLRDCPHSPHLASEIVGLFVHKTYSQAVGIPIMYVLTT